MLDPVTPPFLPGLQAIIAILMGVISSTLGGVLRDTFCNVVPKVFSDRQPYITLAVLGSAIVVGFDMLGLTPRIALVSSVYVTTIARLVVLAWNVSIPVWRA